MLLKLFDDTSFQSAPTLDDLGTFALIVFVLTVLLLIRKGRLKLEDKKQIDFIQNDPLLIDYVEIQTESDATELRKYSLFSRTLAVALILLLLTVPWNNMSQFQF